MEPLQRLDSDSLLTATIKADAEATINIEPERPPTPVELMFDKLTDGPIYVYEGNCSLRRRLASIDFTTRLFETETDRNYGTARHKFKFEDTKYTFKLHIMRTPTTADTIRFCLNCRRAKLTSGPYCPSCQ